MNTIKLIALFLLATLLTACDNTGAGMQKDAENNGEKASQMARDGLKSAEEVGKDASAASMLTPAIKVALTAEPTLNDERNRIDVDSTEERVVLSGHVTTDSQRVLAEEVARRIIRDRNETQMLENRLEVTPR